MIRLFAALDVTGAARFVDEVARGAACGCFCPECGSPLVAKHGEAREWHFAHEAGQERPECEAGAMNMLRRLVVEHLREQPRLELPRYTERVTARSELRLHTTEVGWGAQLVGPLQWLPLGAKNAPVATGRLDNGIEAELLIEIGDERPSYPPPAQDARAELVFWCSMPVLSDLRKRIYAEQHIRQRGQLFWKFQPDTFGLVSAAREQLRAKAKAENDAADSLRRQIAEDKKRRLLPPVTAAADLSSPLSRELAATQDARPVRQPSPVNQGTSLDALKHPWVRHRKANTGLVFYRMNDGSAWVIYTLEQGGLALAPWADATEGWDEALPAMVGTPDVELVAYRISNQVAAMRYLGDNSKKTRSSSNPMDFLGH